jgi:hypothetical protein
VDAGVVVVVEVHPERTNPMMSKIEMNTIKNFFTI